jgi:hypothetical protein
VSEIVTSVSMEAGYPAHLPLELYLTVSNDTKKCVVPDCGV